MNRVAVCQICSTANIPRNLDICRRVIKKARDAGASLIYLPEASDFIAPANSVLDLTKSQENKDFLKGIQQLQRKMTRGSGWESMKRDDTKDSSRVFNTQHMIDPSGTIVESYRKLHLFSIDIKNSLTMSEEKTTIPGQRLSPPVQTSVGKVGLLTCYDLRFPEAALHLRRAGAQIISYPSAFAIKTGMVHWDVLLRARAIETQSYILAPAQVATHYDQSVNDKMEIVGGRSSYGNALIVSPWGDVIARAVENGNTNEGSFVTADIDLDWLEKCRKEIPLWSQRRTDVYPEI